MAERVREDVPVEDGQHVGVRPLGDDAVPDENGLLGPLLLCLLDGQDTAHKTDGLDVAAGPAEFGDEDGAHALLAHLDG